MNPFKKRSLLAAIVLVGGIVASQATSQNQQHDHNAKSGAAPATQPAGAGGMDMAAMEQAWMKAMTPGPQHEALKKLAGEWTCDVKFRMAPDTPEQTSSGYSKNRMIMGGRFLQQDYGGDFMGQPFTGMSLVGFDNTKQKYVSVWLDEMSTGIIMAEGTADAAGKVFTYGGEYMCPVTQANKQYRQITRIIDADKHVSEWYDTAPDGKQFKNMEITFTRKKQAS